MNLLLLLLGLVALSAGAEVLVRSASALAAAARVSPLVIGLTVVAFGTSAPELVVSVQSSWSGQSDIALGNVVGSNIFNVLFILGLSALIAPLVVAQQLVRFEVPLMIALSVVVLLLGLDGAVGRAEGALLAAALAAYTLWSVVQGRRESRAVEEEYRRVFGPPARAPSLARVLAQVALAAVGLLLLVLGSRWFVGSAVDIARALGVGELVIGLTIVAAGTSLPEVATSVLAAFRGERDIAVGNVVGSNIFNILGVLGLSALVAPEGIAVSGAALRHDIPVMIAVAAACLPVLFSGHLIARWEGALFFGYYLAYTAHLVLAATHEVAARTFATVLLGFVVPLTVVTLAIGVVRARR